MTILCKIRLLKISDKLFFFFLQYKTCVTTGYLFLEVTMFKVGEKLYFMDSKFSCFGYFTKEQGFVFS